MSGEFYSSSPAQALAQASPEALRAQVAMMTPFIVLRGSIHLASVNALIYRLQRYLSNTLLSICLTRSSQSETRADSSPDQDDTGEKWLRFNHQPKSLSVPRPPRILLHPSNPRSEDLHCIRSTPFQRRSEHFLFRPFIQTTPYPSSMSHTLG